MMEMDNRGFENSIQLSMIDQDYSRQMEQRIVNSDPCIGWRNLRFEASGLFGRKRKVILNRLNGCFEYHSLNAFMGPSGAGKTTLLNCLNGNRVKGLTPESEIYLNKDQREGKVVSYFIEQHVERTIVGKMRVGQILRYAYRFKNGNEGDMEGHIRKTIDELLLDELVLHRNFEQCSGGEQKRVAIAQELMSLQKPTLLFVDEPTTGLDSNAAHLVMKCLRQLATNHRMAIITSIHVPSDDILTLFDKLYVLAKGGVCIYSGRPDQLRLCLKTEKLEIHPDQPPIEELLRIACSGITDSRVVTLSSKTLAADYRNVSERLSHLDPYPNGVPNHPQMFSIWQLFLQIGRMFQIIFVANARLFYIQLFIGTIFLLVISSIFSANMAIPSGCVSIDGSGNSTCSNKIDKDSVLNENLHFLGLMMFYFGLVVMSFGAVTFSPIVRVFYNEHRNHWYSLGVFFWSATVVCLLQVSIYTILYTLFGYLYSGQHVVDNYELNWYRIFDILLNYFLLAIYTQALGQLVGTLLMNRPELSIVVAHFGYVLIGLYYGYFVDLEFSHDPLVNFVRIWIRFNSIFKTFLCQIYGLGRCKPETEYSIVILNYHIEPEKIPEYPLQILINMAVIRAINLAYLYWSFNSFVNRKNKSKDFQGGEDIMIMPIDFVEEKKNKGKDINNNRISIMKRDKSSEEIKFEKFSRGKIVVAWRDLSLFGTSFLTEQTELDVDRGSVDKKAILKNLNGEFRFGTLNAVMGTSGAGKTSLLKVLNGRDKTRLSAQSQFYLSKFTRIQTCFITQDVSGHLLPGLTAKQMLVYASRLKNAQLRECGVDTSKIDHQQIALNLLDELDLSDTMDTPVEKCSGGERKRLALALELTALQMPNLICIDEPTSGLDSNSAEKVVACLRKLTQTHSITIVASIHQPNTEVLLMFDQIYVLARGGVCIYSGHPISIQPHLETVSQMPNSVHSKFPIETLIKLSCNSFPDPFVRELMYTNQLQFNKTVVDSGLLEQETQLVPDGIQQNRRRFSLEDTWILFLRYMAYIRGYLWIELLAFSILLVGYALFMSQLFDPVIAVPSGCVSLDDDFNNTCTRSEERIYEDSLLVYNFQYLFVAFCVLLVLILYQLSLSFSRESIYFFNEHQNGWYSSGSFYLMKSVIDMIPIFLVVLVYIYLCDIYESVRPGIYPYLVLVLGLSAVVYQGMACNISLLSRGNIPLMMILNTSLFLFYCFISNYSRPILRLHYFYRLLSHISPNRFMLESVIVLLYGFDRCLPKQIQPLMWLFSLDDSDYYHGVKWLIFNMILYHGMALTILIHRSNTEQNRRHRIQRITQYLAQLTPTNHIVAGLDAANNFRIKLIRF